MNIIKEHFYTYPPLPIPGNKIYTDLGRSTNLGNTSSQNDNLKDVIEGWLDNSNYGDYSGTIRTNSQLSAPMEGNSFTLVYETGRILKCFHNGQDAFDLNYYLNY